MTNDRDLDLLFRMENEEGGEDWEEGVGVVVAAGALLLCFLCIVLVIIDIIEEIIRLRSGR